jgi:hypothetical protein
MVYAPGLCEARHHHDKANFIYIVEGSSQLDVEAAALQLLLGESGASRRKATPPWVLRVRDMLREEVQARVTLAALRFDCTIGEYLRRARVARAQILLRLRDLEISDIAAASLPVAAWH